MYRRQAGISREQRISVCVRKRPLTHAESRRGEADAVTTPGGDCVIVHESKDAVDLTQYILQVDMKDCLSDYVFMFISYLGAFPCVSTAQILL